jgi:hypothetical protein
MAAKTYSLRVFNFWLGLRPPSTPLLYSERYGGKPGLRLFGWRLHARRWR